MENKRIEEIKVFLTALEEIYGWKNTLMAVELFNGYSEEKTWEDIYNEKASESAVDRLKREIQDNLLYLHRNFDDKGEWCEKKPEEFAENDWQKIKYLLKLTYQSGYKDGNTMFKM